MILSSDLYYVELGEWTDTLLHRSNIKCVKSGCNVHLSISWVIQKLWKIKSYETQGWSFVPYPLSGWVWAYPWTCRGLPAGPRCKWFSLPEGDRVVLCSSVSLSYSCVESFIQRRPSIEMIQGNNWLMTILMSIDVYLFSMHWYLLQLSLIFRPGQRYSSSCMSNQTVKRELIEV